MEPLVFRSKINSRKAIFYIHGGGLMFGTAHDLPEAQIDFFTDQAYTVYCLEYPLAPETNIKEIKIDLITQIKALISQENIEDYLLFGRSAGAFLAFQIASELNPKAIISFYGYALKTEGWADMPNKQALSHPLVSEKSVNAILSTQKLFDKDMKRYALYIYARQTGQWQSMMGEGFEDVDFNKLPPLFLWHSLFDPDVPYRESKLLYENVENSILLSSFQKKHEIDITEFNVVKDPLKQFLSTIK